MKDKRIIEKVVETPAVILGNTVEATEAVEKAITGKSPAKRAKDYWDLLGPGLTTGASDDDPSGIATYSQAGSQFGFKFLWVSPLTYPLMSVVQEMCARIGLVTGRGLASNIKQYFPKSFLYLIAVLLFVANAFNIGANLGAMAKATELLIPGFSVVGLVVFYTLLCVLMQIYLPYKIYARYLKWLALVLLAYIFSTLLIPNFDWGKVFNSVIRPNVSLNQDSIMMFCALLGTTISPYLFFWQTSQEVEEKVAEGETTVEMRRNAINAKQIKNMRIDVWSGMFLSNLVMFFIISACAATLNISGITQITDAAQAAEALRPLAGENAYILFSIGILGTGLLSVPVLSGSASYAISESFNWNEGLNKKIRQAYAFYGVIIIAMLVGLVLNFVGLKPFMALIYSAVLNGLVAPIILFAIVKISSDKKMMGSFASGPWARTIGYLATAIMALAGIATIITLLF